MFLLPVVGSAAECNQGVSLFLRRDEMRRIEWAFCGRRNLSHSRITLLLSCKGRRMPSTRQLVTTFQPPPDFKIVSGGQTGADQAALDWAISHGIAHGGWWPRGRRSGGGLIDPRYLLLETPVANYLQRTEWNVRDSDASVIFTLSKSLESGSKRTKEL